MLFICPYPANLRSMLFRSDQAGYLAGSLAGLMSESDVVGAVGGMEIPPVMAFTDPYRQGALCSNSSATVIVTYTNNFGDPLVGAQAAQALMAQGALPDARGSHTTSTSCAFAFGAPIHSADDIPQ